MKLLAGLLGGVLCFLLSALPVHAKPVLVAAASNAQFAFADLIDRFRQVHPDVPINISFGSSGNFHSQIVHGAPYDIFFSADVAYPQKLESAGLAGAGGKTTAYVFGAMVLWVAKRSALDVREEKFAALLRPEIKKIAIANPRHAPYGRAAVESMRHFGVYEKVRDRLVMGENISQAAQFADSGAAQAGIIALSLAVSGNMKSSGAYWEIPTESHSPIVQSFLILKNGGNLQGAAAFAKFVLGPEGRSIFKRHGYRTPGGSRTPRGSRMPGGGTP